MSDFSKWYRTGTVSVTKGSKTVTGSNTYWLNASLHSGDLFSIDSVTEYEIDSVTDSSHLTLKTPYSDASASGSGYRIIRNFTASMPAEIAAQTASLLDDFMRYVDTDMQTVQGRSAYEVAVKNGYTGTESQWLNSLIGAGKWAELQASTSTSLNSYGTRLTAAEGTVSSMNSTVSTLSARTSFIADAAKNADFHNSVFRGKQISNGAPSEAQKAAIRTSAFDDMFIGDFFADDGIVYRIAHFNYCPSKFGEGNIVLIYPSGSRPRVKWYTDDNTAYDPRYNISNWYLNERPFYETQTAKSFGADNIVEWDAEYYVYNLTTHMPAGWGTGARGKCHLASPSQVWGGIDTDFTNLRPAPSPANQLAFCRYRPLFGCYRLPIGWGGEYLFTQVWPNHGNYNTFYKDSAELIAEPIFIYKP